MSELMLFGIICLMLGAGVFACAVYISAGNSKGDDERFKESIGNMCWGAIVASLLLCGRFAIDVDSKRTTKEECRCQIECCEADSTMVIKSE